MEKTKVKVIETIIGRYDCDSIIVEIDKVKTEICFNKKENVDQYIGQEIYLSQDKGVFVISALISTK